MRLDYLVKRHGEAAIDVVAMEERDAHDSPDKVEI